MNELFFQFNLTNIGKIDRYFDLTFQEINWERNIAMERRKNNQKKPENKKKEIHNKSNF